MVSTYVENYRDVFLPFAFALEKISVSFKSKLDKVL